MPKIVVKHTRIEINNYNIGDSPRLENFFMIYDPLRHISTPQCIAYDEYNKRLLLPRGIDVPYLEQIFQCDATLDQSCDKYSSTGQIMIKYLPRDDNQKEALRFTLAQKEYRYTSVKSQLSLNLNTGAGKTYIAVASLAFMQMRSIIIASSIGWLEQWKNCILQYTDIESKEIFIISGVGSIHKLMNSDLSKYKVFLASHNTIKSYGDKNGWEAVTDLFKKLEVGLKVYDEAHLNLTNLSMIDFYTNTYKTLYLTATPARSNKDENSIYQLYFKNIPKIDLFNEETDPRTDYIAIRFNSHPTPQEITRSKNAYGFNRLYYVNNIVHKDNFKRLLHVLMEEIIRPCTGKVLIYIGTNEAILNVKEWLETYYPEYKNDIGVYTSITTTNKKAELDKKIILSTTKSCGAAVDIKGLKATIVLAEPFKSEVIARQSLGRTRDRDTRYYDVVDDGYFYCRKYNASKKHIFEKYATSCEVVNLNASLGLESNNIINRRSSCIIPIVKADPPMNGIIKPITKVVKPMDGYQ